MSTTPDPRFRQPQVDSLGITLSRDEIDLACEEHAQDQRHNEKNFLKVFFWYLDGFTKRVYKKRHLDDIYLGNAWERFCFCTGPASQKMINDANPKCPELQNHWAGVIEYSFNHILNTARKYRRDIYSVLSTCKDWQHFVLQRDRTMALLFAKIVSLHFYLQTHQNQHRTTDLARSYDDAKQLLKETTRDVFVQIKQPKQRDDHTLASKYTQLYMNKLGSIR